MATGKFINKSVVLKTIRESSSIARKDLIQKTQISSPTITRILNTLIEKNLVLDLGIGESNGGRPPQILQFNGNSSLVIGFSWALTELDGVLSNLDGHIVAEFKRNIPVDFSLEQDLCIIDEAVGYFLAQAKQRDIPVKGIGVGVAGYVNTHGVIMYSVVQRWRDLDLAALLKKKYHLDVFVDSGSRAVTVGELLFGSAIGLDNALVVINDYGLYSGIIINGEVIKGEDGVAGEIGHCRIDLQTDEQRRCLCGKMNCLAEYSAGRGILKTAQQQLPENSLLSEISQGNPSLLKYTDVLQATEQGDSFSCKIVEESAMYFAKTLSNLSIFLNPKAIILSGSVCRNLLFFHTVENYFNAQKLKQVYTSTQIKMASNEKHAGARGAASLLIDKLLNLEI